MKISINWLKEYINFSETPQEISNLLTQSGLEVSHIETFEPIQGNLAGMLVGQIVSWTKHPNADKLHCTQVDVGTTNPLSIVCGAPNVKVGQKVAVAPVGVTLYTYTGEHITIKATKIRGVLSEGMLCAEDEIGLGPNHEKILCLDTTLPAGTPLNQYFNLQADTVLTIELTPNRIDACSHIGVARELRALLDTPIQYPHLLQQLTATKQLLPLQVTVHESKACPRYAGILMAGVQVQESPYWLQYKLKAVGLHPINNVVDITNLVMYELGQPLHAFDYDKLNGHQIHVKWAEKGEKILTLDNLDRVLTGQELMIADQRGNIALAGILGGKSTGVTEQTKIIFLESAYFSPQAIRTAAKHHKLQTDAAFWYERGTDPNLPVVALQRACLLIREIAGGRIATQLIDIYPHPINPLHIEVLYKNIQNLIGQYIPPKTIHHILRNLDIAIIREDEASFTALVPPYRVDVTREVDIIEEVLRIYGYEKIQVQEHLHSTFLAGAGQPLLYQLIQRLSPILVANGYQEICTNSLTAAHDEAVTDKDAQEQRIKLLNPLSDKLGALRDNLIFSGLEVIAHNINRKQFDLKLFEFGKTYHQINTQYLEKNKLSIWLTGKIEAPNWIRQARAANFQDLHAILHKILAKWGINTLTYKTLTNPSYKAGVQLFYQTKLLVTLGELGNSYVQMAGIHQPVLFADVDIDQLIIVCATPKVHYQPISKFPVVKRDLSLLLDHTVLFEDIKKVLAEQQTCLIQDIHVFDVYQGANLPANKKAYALSFTLQDKDKTLDEKTICQVMTHLINAFQEKLGAIIRE